MLVGDATQSTQQSASKTTEQVSGRYSTRIHIGARLNRVAIPVIMLLIVGNAQGVDAIDCYDVCKDFTSTLAKIACVVACNLANIGNSGPTPG